MKLLSEILQDVGNTAEFGFSPVTSVNQRSLWGDTPLHIVCRWGDEEAVKVLLHSGASVNAVGDGGWTPLFCALHSGSITILRALLHAGADPFIREEDGNTAAEYALIGDNLDSGNVQAIVDELQNAMRKRGSFD